MWTDSWGVAPRVLSDRRTVWLSATVTQASGSCYHKRQQRAGRLTYIRGEAGAVEEMLCE
jgi:hypothetical protein